MDHDEIQPDDMEINPVMTSTRSIKQAIESLVIALDVQVHTQPTALDSVSQQNIDIVDRLIAAAEASDIFLRPTPYQSVDETFAIIRQGYAVVFSLPSGELLVLERPEGRKIIASRIGDEFEHCSIGKPDLRRLLEPQESIRMMVAKKEFECETLSGSHDHNGSGGEHEHALPIQRLIALLNLDRRDIGLVVLFAGVSGVLGLATPLVIEGLVNVVSWGTYFQPLVVLAGMLMTCLAIAAVLKILQTWVVEIIQRRQFVRIVSDLAHRFPRANQRSLVGEYPRELANRVFDIMTIQKATAVLLLDGVSVALTTVLGLVLLAFYHPFLLGFDIVLVFSMVFFTWLLGHGGIESAIKESKTKYAVAHWLQDVLSMPNAFKSGGGETLAILRANQLTSEYVRARKKQFSVVIRQVIFAVGLQAVASTVLLGLGGWLVINGQLTLGQLVASELVVTVVVGAFAKAGKSLEKFYDMMAGIDKVGHLLDIPADPRVEIGVLPSGPMEISWNDLALRGPTRTTRIPQASIDAGWSVCLVGDDSAGKSLFARAIAGQITPEIGVIQLGAFEAVEGALARPGALVGYAGSPEIFHGTVTENVNLGRRDLSMQRVRQALTDVDLLESVLSLPGGLSTKLQTGGYPLTRDQQDRLMIARAIVSRPRVLVIDGLLDGFGPGEQDQLWKSLTSDSPQWTLIVVSNCDGVAKRCTTRISVRQS
ncbi:MAG: ABC transporter ATP-binding protein [Planctomycetales bacterium]|nr:ABC transporter ATP-binding protein [Planctomycetales bacterium]